MKKINANNFEIYIWIGLVIATIVNLFFPWYLAQNTNFFLLIIVLIACASLYIKSRRLYYDSERKTSELVKQQKEISNHQKTIDLIFNHSEDGILALDHNQRIISFSPGMERISGYKKEEVLGLSAEELLKFKGDKNNSLLPDLMFIQSGIKTHPYVRNSLTTKEGRDIMIEASYTLTTDLKTHLSTGIAIIRDITYEEELIRRDKEFIAITSHQMNTPLSIVRGYSSLLLKERVGKLNTEQKKYLEEIYGGIVKLISLTNNLLSISRIEQEKIKLVREDLSVSELFSKLKENFEKIAVDKKIDLNIIKPDKDIVFYADHEKIYQVLSNLIDNSIKYTVKGSVNLESEKTKDQMIFKIKDTGIGISKDDIDNVGQKFYRAQRAIDIDNKGTGLGLFIAKSIVEKHGGKLEIESKEEKGTTITIQLPLN